MRSTKVFARSFSPGIRVRMRACAVASALTPMRRQPRQHVAGQARIIGAAQPLAVQMRQLGIIHPARRAAHAFQREQGNLLLADQKLGIAMPPAEAEQVIAQRLGQKTLLAEFQHADRAVAFREFRAVGAVDERDMREMRRLPAHRVVDLDLPERVGQMVVAADDMADRHVMVVHHHGMQIGRRAV